MGQYQNKQKEDSSQDYESLFIMRIVQVIRYNEQTLFSYIDNVLDHHFSAYQEVISDLYDKRNTGIFNTQFITTKIYRNGKF